MKLKDSTYYYIGSIVVAAALVGYLINNLIKRKIEDQRLLSEKDNVLKDKLLPNTTPQSTGQYTETSYIPILIIKPPTQQHRGIPQKPNTPTIPTTAFKGKTMTIFGNAYASKNDLIALANQYGHGIMDDKFHQKLYITFKSELGQPIIDYLKNKALTDYIL